jgi:hypothetical protein
MGHPLEMIWGDAYVHPNRGDLLDLSDGVNDLLLGQAVRLR